MLVVTQWWLVHHGSPGGGGGWDSMQLQIAAKFLRGTL